MMSCAVRFVCLEASQADDFEPAWLATGRACGAAVAITGQHSTQGTVASEHVKAAAATIVRSASET